MDIEFYDLYNENTGDFETLTRQQLSEKVEDAPAVSRLIGKTKRSTKGYMLIETYSNEQTLLDVTNFYLNKRSMVKAFRRYLTDEQANIILGKGDQWLTDLSISSTFAPTLRKYCPRC